MAFASKTELLADLTAAEFCDSLVGEPKLAETKPNGDKWWIQNIREVQGNVIKYRNISFYETVEGAFGYQDALPVPMVDKPSKFITIRNLLGDLPVATGVSVIGKLKASQNPAVQIAWDMMSTYAQGGGIDIKNANTIAVLDSLVADGTLTADEGTALKAL